MNFVRRSSCFLLTLVSACLLAGCASPVRQGRQLPDAARLARSLNELTGETAAEESGRIAEAVINRSRDLAIEYRSIRPPWLHNVLVNVGLRDRGLCWHWVDDMEPTLMAMDLEHFTVHRVVARLETWREHNCLALSVRGESWEEALVLDGWRHAGRLSWVLVKADKYPWQERVFATND